jgi:hypothetical protein
LNNRKNIRDRRVSDDISPTKAAGPRRRAPVASMEA